MEISHPFWSFLKINKKFVYPVSSLETAPSLPSMPYCLQIIEDVDIKLKKSLTKLPV